MWWRYILQLEMINTNQYVQYSSSVSAPSEVIYINLFIFDIQIIPTEQTIKNQ